LTNFGGLFTEKKGCEKGHLDPLEKKKSRASELGARRYQRLLENHSHIPGSIPVLRISGIN
jgi:hypothetical protein